MLIKSLTLENFRQYKGIQSLQFATNPIKNVTVLLGDNTFGKTTLLQSFNWCLYGTASFPKDSNPDFLLNYETAQENEKSGSKINVSVTLNLNHNGVDYTIKRIQPYFYQLNHKTWSGAKITDLKVTYKENGITRNLDDIYGSSSDSKKIELISSILPKSLSSYFFFDTERVSDISDRKDLAAAVKGLLGLQAVELARKDYGKKSQPTSAIGKWYALLDSDKDKKLEDANRIIEEKSNEIKRIEDQLALYDKEKENWVNIKKVNQEILNENQESANLEKKVEQKEEEKKKQEELLEECYNAFLDYYKSSAISFQSISLFRIIKKQLADSDIEDEGVRDLTETSIQDLIHRGRCICGAKIISEEDGHRGNDAYYHLIDELKYVPPAHLGTAIQAYKELISTDEQSLDQFYPTIVQKYKEINRIRNKIDSIETEVVLLRKQIDDLGKLDLQQAQENLDKAVKNIKICEEKKRNDLVDKAMAEKEIDQQLKIKDSLVVVNERNKKLQKCIAYGEYLVDWINDVYDQREEEIRKQLEERVNLVFEKMYHGKREVTITQKYDVILKTQMPDGTFIQTGESEGLKRVKNFAFIAGLVDIAKEKASIGNNKEEIIEWENEAYPLVMDAPYSNADKTHIINISKVLPEIANQVIFFVMEKDWHYAEEIMKEYIGEHYSLNQISETHTEILKNN